MPAGAIHQLSVTDRRRPGVPGMLISLEDYDSEIYINDNPQAEELYTLVIDTATADETYGVDLTDPVAVDVNYTSDNPTSLAAIANNMATNWNASPLAAGIATALSDGVDTVTFTGVFPGIAFTMAEDENAAKMSLTNTTDAAGADPIPFGRAMVSLGFLTDYPEPRGILASSSVLTAQVDTITVTYAAGERYTVTLMIEGERYQVDVDADTDTATTCTAIATAINAAMPATSVLADGSSGTTVVLTAELAGKTFLTTVGTADPTNAVLVHTTSGPGTDFNQVFCGISKHSYDTQQAQINVESAEYAANAGVEAVRRGDIWVASTESVTAYTAVYVELDPASDDRGRCYTTATSTRVRVDPALMRWLRSDHASSDGDVAGVRVDLAA